MRGLRCARSHPCFNFSPFCVALTTIDWNALKTEHWWRERGVGGGVKWVDRRPQVYQLLLSQPFFSNYKAGAVWLSLRGMLGPCKGNTRRGEEDSSSFLPSYVLDISSFVPPPPQNCYSVYDWLRWGDLLFRVYARVKARNEPAGDGPGAGVRSCYTGSSIMRSKMYKRRHLRKFQTMISSSIRKLNYGHLWQYGEPTCTWTVAV